MDIYMVKACFGWMTVINLAFYLLTVILCTALRTVVYSTAQKFFGIDEEKVPTIIYAYIGAYKLLFIFFNLIPWLALVILLK